MEGSSDVKGKRNRHVIYTAIFGGYDALQEPKVVPPGFDFVCFSDRKIPSKHWQVRVVEPTEEDPTRNNRKYKILPHRYLGGYGISVYIDGNVLVRGDINKLIEQHLTTADMALYDHRYARHRDRGETPDKKESIYQEADALIAMHERGRTKEDPVKIREQVERYRKEGYPNQHAHAITTVLIRRHNEPDVIAAMEAWWCEYQKGSKRDQLSFNYITWKTGFSPYLIRENVRNNEFFLMKAHGKK